MIKYFAKYTSILLPRDCDEKTFILGILKSTFTYFAIRAES